MATAQIVVRVTDDAGNVTQGQAVVTLAGAPVITSVTVVPSTLPATGGIVVVTINATSADGRPLTYAVVPSQGTAVQRSATPNVFDWTLP